MAQDRFNFPEIDLGYNPYLIFPPAIYDPHLVSADELPWTVDEEQDFDFFDSFDSPCYKRDDEPTGLEAPDQHVGLPESVPVLTRTRALTGESVQSSDGVGSFEVNGSWAAKVKQKQRRQDAKVQGQFRCTVQDCPRYERPFGSSSDRRRHLAESHAVDPTGAFQTPRPCPWPQCVRAHKSFKRQRNLDEHLIKKHSGKRPESGTDSKASTDSISFGAEAPYLKSEGIASTTPTARSLVASPQLRAKRLDRAKHREYQKRRIADLKRTGEDMASDIAVVRVKFLNIKSRLHSMEEAEKLHIQLIQTLNEQMIQGDLEDDVHDAPTDAQN